jgi:hypothetical protein
MKSAVFALLSLVLTGAASAQQTGAPPCSEPVFRQFDFWLGEWEVFNQKGVKAGENRITREEYGCLLLEKWTAANGVTGQSYNFVDLNDGRWRQVWVSAGATIDYKGGLDAQGRMVLEGTIGYGAGVPGNGDKFRGSWTPNADGTVTQHFEQFDPVKNEWSDWFVGTYRRKAEK